MANEIKIRITSEADAKGFKDVNKELKDTSTVAQIAGRSIDVLDDKIGDVGKTASGTRTDIDKLDRTIEISTTSLKELASAFANADDAAQRLDIKKAMNRAQAELSTSLKARKILNVEEMIETKPSPVFKSKVDDGLGSAVSDAGDSVAKRVGKKVGMTIGVAIGAVVASSAGTIISAGIGGGLIGAGVGLAVAKDKQIQEAGRVAGGNFLDGMQEKAVKAFKGPALDALGLLAAEGDRISDKMGKGFQAVAPHIRPLVEDIVISVDRITDAFVNVASDSGPALASVGNSLVLLSDGVGDFLETVTSGSPEAADNLTLVAGVLADLMRIGGEAFNLVNKITEVVIPGLAGMRDHYKSVAEESNHLSGEQGTLSRELTVAADAATGQRDALESLANTLKAQTDPVFGMIDAQERLEKAQKDYNKAIAKGKDGSEEADKALRDMAKASIDLEGKVGALGDEFNGNITPALRATLRAAGMTDSEINALAKQFRNAKKDGDRFAKKYSAEAKVNGIPTANRQVDGLMGKLSGIQNTWVGNVVVRVKEFFTGGKAHGGIQGAASGRIGSGLTWVGESGPELASLPAGTTVHSAGDSQRMMRRALESGGGMSGELIVRAAPSAQHDLMSVLVESLQFYVRTQAGGSVQRAFGKPGVAA